MSRTKRDEFALSGSKGFRRCRTFSKLKAEVMAVDAVEEEGFSPSNRQKHLANLFAEVNPSRDDREIAALRELPKACRGW